MTGEDVLKNTLAAQRAIPDLGYGWRAGELKRLGARIQQLCPELAAWLPELAGEAHLFFASRGEAPNRPLAWDPGTERHDGFLPFLIGRIMRAPGGPL